VNQDTTIMAFDYWPADMSVRLVQRFDGNVPKDVVVVVKSHAANDGTALGSSEQSFEDYGEARKAFADKIKEIL
jgi:hypothetical protein